MPVRVDRGVSRPTPIRITIDGVDFETYEGETIASALLIAGNLHCYTTPTGRPRTMFCNMGTCFECRVVVGQGEDQRWVLACNTPVEPDMCIATGTCFPGPMALDQHD
ncbi:putative sarcosine oxidase alpha subunit [Luminiphilus syltensis NOR5-1B]|uniref:Putative sarcosine oxidase alpha subunit n=1 Tax=Luminiphilus syltensis NOR5-1B TaxID=565045 RepID=B8KS50_9GAMM|nr:(2Fe-2S)-binding protein [Luminiphilus syltensis]EED36047.1 putative sarcosine oxidase alpha subunit [Luminiphilus syltensis NOR5-1B]